MSVRMPGTTQTGERDMTSSNIQGRKPSILRKKSFTRQDSESSGYSSGSSSPDSSLAFRRHRRTVTFHQDLLKDIQTESDEEDHDDEMVREKGLGRALELGMVRDTYSWVTRSVLDRLTGLLGTEDIANIRMDFFQHLDQTVPVLKQETKTVVEKLKVIS